jgi:uncharacterized surface protein with fasciclin (FAS1) repeats
MTFVRFAAVLSLAACVAAPALAQTAPAPVAAASAAARVSPAGDTIETLRASGQFTTLLKALDAAQLTALIKGQRTLTLFAPTDAAFAALPPGELDRLMRDPPTLQALLTYHLINLPVDSAKIIGARGPIATVAGAGVVLDGVDGALKANDANIVQADIRTPNGIIHVVDRVLKPESGAAITQRLKDEDAATAKAETEAGAAPAE